MIRPRLLLLFVCLMCPPYLFSQAWTQPRGEGYVSLTFEDIFVKDHFLSSGDRIDLGHIRTVGIIQSIDYGVTDRLSASVSLPVIASKYYGPDPHQIPADNGNYHGGTQDFAVGLRYRLPQRRIVLTPFVALSIPSRGYTFYAHSAVGTGQRELALGIAAGKRFEDWLPDAYFQAAYSYGIVESVTGVRPNRNHISLEGGYFLGRHLTLRALADSQLIHGGFDIPQDFPQISDYPLVADERWRHHDQSANANFLNLGGGIDVALGRRWDVFAALTHTLWGENGHATRLGLSAGVAWSFRTPRAISASADIPPTPTSTLHPH